MKKTILLLLILSFFSSCKAKENKKTGALSFTLKNLNGEMVNLEDFKDKYVLIDFWATWCGPCVKAMPYIVELYNKYGGDKFTVIGIALDNEIDVKNFVESRNIPYLILLGNNDIAMYYNVRYIPTIVLLSPDKENSKIIYKNVGFSEEEMKSLEEKIKEVSSSL
uniref:TlpA family protein disulfide reductase n=1 Tax=candidate division WOR-3 bacterium TaxID=2052148 RepID=A0A7C4YSS6_UNCW3